MFKSTLQASSQVDSNIRAHDKIAKKYEKIHGEIYNDVEQARLKDMLARALAEVRTQSDEKVALDFGCGAGNLTKHLSSLGIDVIACDVSQGFLDLVASRSYETKVETKKINGADLSNIADGTVDIIATYSVLHHVPDYLSLMNEFVRVLKQGGVIFIDHELSAEVWEKPSAERLAFLREMNPSPKRSWRKYFLLENYVNWVILKFVNPRYRPEGDIHVFPDDHIEWEMISDRLIKADAEILVNHSYLLFKRGYDANIYKKYADLLTDMQVLIARKL